MNSLAVEVNLTVKTCPVCHITYAAPAAMFEEITRTDGSWYCPRGHSLIFTESEINKVKRKLAAAQENEMYYRERTEEEYEARKKAERSARSYKGVSTRIKNRISKGVCPCCKRSFADLHEHMKTKHPTWANAEGDE